MRDPRATLACTVLLVAAACGKVERGGDGGPGDHRDGGGSGDGGGTIISDASPPDATPVACDGPEDCANPDDPCLVGGTCEDNVCHFEEMDCGELDGECTVGICRDGTCRPKSIREDMGCGTGVMACGGYGSCGGFGDECDESGTETRSCTDSTCQSGECVTGAPYDDSRGCTRSTTGDPCGLQQTIDCQSCVYSQACDNSDPVECTVTDYSCASQVCTPSESTVTDNDLCDRETEGNPCGPQGDGCCTPTGTCAPSCV